jgi:TATA-box binding protein (TBP) (component of TFIID and TFIIIB)
MFHDEDEEEQIHDEMDLKMIEFIKILNNKENETIPQPSYFIISTQSAMCNIDKAISLDLSKIVIYIAQNIISNIILKKDEDYLIRGIVVDNLIIRFDESYLKKYKKPFIKYLDIVINPNNMEDCLLMLSNIHLLENNSLKKQGRQKKKDIEHFYNSCSIIVKGGKNIKGVNIKLFNNGKITLTGSKNEKDGYFACSVLLEEMKKYPDIFIGSTPEILKEMKITNYQITMINSDFNTNFKIDLIKLLTILNHDDKNLFTKFNPEKYRGLIIGFYWNLNKEDQDGKCHCKSKCNGKGQGNGDGKCKKITISIFKSGSIIITGARLVRQIEDAYHCINSILKEHYHEVIKLSILDYIDSFADNDEDNEDNEGNEVEYNQEDYVNDYITKPEFKNKKDVNININININKKGKIQKIGKKEKSIDNEIHVMKSTKKIIKIKKKQEIIESISS